MKTIFGLRRGAFAFAAVSALAAISVGVGALARKPDESEAAATPASDDSLPIVLVHNADPVKGRDLFVTKGCVICHSVNGAGGRAAPPLDAPEDAKQADLMDFVAGMWAGAYAMTELQAIELGYQIELSGPELGHLAAFATTPQAQTDFSIASVPEPMRDWLLDEPYWEEDDWPSDFGEGDFGAAPTP